MATKANTRKNFKERVLKLRGNLSLPPDASIIFPVNAQADLENLINTIEDVLKYQGEFKIELIPVINNYPPEKPPAEIARLREEGVNVVAVPDARVPGEVVGFSARIPGVRAATSEITIHFDADCHIPNPTKLIDFYINTLQTDAALAYTPVLFFDLRPGITIQIHVLLHHFSRWIKRNILRIPTPRGSNYAIKKSVLLEMYDNRLLSEDIFIGTTLKALGKKCVYSPDKEKAVYTSGRMFNPGIKYLYRYLKERILFHIRYFREMRMIEKMKRKKLNIAEEN
ncbi:MAG: hypothetical protein Kow0037_25540 [Calditrichia bacterium]